MALEKNDWPRRGADAVNALFAIDRASNPYVEVVAAGVRAAGAAATVGLEAFRTARPFPYDVAHIQWPEALFGWRVPGPADLAALRRRLAEVRAQAKVVYTRHNRASHVANPENREILAELYGLIETGCDAMVHLGETSRAECAERPELRDIRHETIPIPVYDELYAPFLEVDRGAARHRLGLAPERAVVLAFGKFRSAAEKRLVQEARNFRAGRRALWLASKWHRARDYSFSPRHPLLALRSLREAAWAWRRGMRLAAKRAMADEEVALEYAAADVVFVPRLDELNSGNVPMAFLFGKVVAGPDCGNIGGWLRATGNPTFDPRDPESVRAALGRALDLAAAGHGAANRRFALEHWSTRRIGHAHVRLYRRLCAAAPSGGEQA